MTTKKNYSHPTLTVVSLSTTRRGAICLTTSGNFETTQDETEEDW